MHTRSTSVLAVILIAAGLLVTASADAQVRTFATGSYVIPMDTDYQDNGMLRAYGLLYRLLRAGVPVAWVI